MIATQNPREFEGTYPLPESQLDRFMLRIDMDYPAARGGSADPRALRRGAERRTGSAGGRRVTGAAAVAGGTRRSRTVHVAEALSAYVLDLARASREHAQLTLGLSTRGALAMLRAARIVAALRGAEFVSPDDVKEAAQWVMAHRLVLSPEAALEGVDDVTVVKSLLSSTPVPR